MKKWLGLALLSVIVAGAGLLLFNGDEQQAPEPEITAPESLRRPPAGPVIGYRDDDNTHAWRNIPYARPPVGELRWKAPRPANPWSELLQATEAGPPCVQYWGGSAGVAGEPGDAVGSEDCLTLSIWAPATPPESVPAGDDRLPVMFWIHGGGNSVGTGNTYNGAYLAGNHGVIVVGIDYRLGILGWFSHDILRKTSSNAEDASGNFGLLDIIAALKWVRSNISTFGGNPDNITVFGESAGGNNVYALVASPLARGLFQRAIVQSGYLATTERSRAENYTDEQPRGARYSSGNVLVSLLRQSGTVESVTDARDYLQRAEPGELMATLRATTPQELQSVFEADGFGMYLLPANIRDGHVLPDQSTLTTFAQGGDYARVPLMLGTTRDEHKVFMIRDEALVGLRFGLLPYVKDAALYNRLSAYYADNWKMQSVDEPARVLAATGGPPVFAYRFDWDETPSNWKADLPTLVGAGHAFELSFVFGDFESGINTPFLFTVENRPGREYIAKAMTAYWAQFAKTGNPGQGTGGDLPHWHPWAGEQEGQLMIFDTPADGGVRMEAAPLTVELLKTRLANDLIITAPRQRCRMYVEMFLTGFTGRDFWDNAEYRKFAGGECANFDPYRLALGGD